MNEQNQSYRKQVRRINNAAAFFASQGYQCDTTFFARRAGMTFTVFFRDIDEKETIRDTLRQYAAPVDQIVFKDYPDYHFYTFRLEIYES